MLLLLAFLRQLEVEHLGRPTQVGRDVPVYAQVIQARARAAHRPQPPPTRRESELGRQGEGRAGSQLSRRGASGELSHLPRSVRDLG